MNKLLVRVITSIAVAAIILLALGGVAAPVQAGGGPTFVPISPNGATESISPTFVWYIYPGAFQYTVGIYNNKGKLVLIQTVYSYHCGSTYCRYIPSIKLAIGATYHWSVAAWSSALPVSSGTWLYFTVYKPFSSSFANSTGWKPVYGTWAAHGGNYIGSQSNTAGYVGSAYYTKGQYDTFTYETRMNLEGCNNCWAIMYFNGNPVGQNYQGSWDNTYEFQYQNNGNFSIWKLSGGVYTHLEDSTSPYITSSWNILTVTYNASTGYAQFFINHVLVADTTLDDFRSGYVGVGLWSYGSPEQVDVDYADLTAGAPAYQVGSGVTRAANFVHFTGKPVLAGNGPFSR